MLKPPDPDYIETSDDPTAFDLIDMQMEDGMIHVLKAAYWLHAIAVLSIIGIFLQVSDPHFIGNLALPGVLEKWISGEPKNKILHYAIQLSGAFPFLVFGYFGSKRKRWALIAGMTIYVCDTLCALVLNDWLAFTLHLFIFVNLILDFQTLRKYEALVKSKPVNTKI